MIELTTDQMHVVVEMDKLARGAYQTKTYVVGIFLNFRKQYINEVIPERSKAKKFEKHNYYQRLIREQKGLREAFETFDQYNSGYKDLIVEAFFKEDYEVPLLVKRGQIVKVFSQDCTYVGLCGEDIYRGREKKTVELFSNDAFRNPVIKFVYADIIK